MNEREGVPKPVLHHVVALGRSNGLSTTLPLDSICAWLLNQEPTLLTKQARENALTRVRTTAMIIDQLLLDLVQAISPLNQEIHIWTYGAGFDGRWERLHQHLQGSIRYYHEVEAPSLLKRKHAALHNSPFRSRWAQIDQRPTLVDKWGLEETPSGAHVAILEGLWARLDLSTFENILERLHAKEATSVLLDLPMKSALDDEPLRRKILEDSGWQIQCEQRLQRRRKLKNPLNQTSCAGIEPIRVLQLTRTHHGPR